MRTTSRKRGAMLLGLAAIILIGSFLTWAILQRSFDAYLVSANAELRHQALAAAEGGLEWLEAGHEFPGNGLEVGNCLLLLDHLENGNAIMKVHVHRAGGADAVMVRTFQIFPGGDGTTWRLERLP
ncbi:MAG: hypothetical protein JJU11_01520 [Candidatus Sumerlaeia bacterium]|nr:hypothetical protein [Candidatus Sumerlaeia bacterium]